jgi:hypothetical protein
MVRQIMGATGLLAIGLGAWLLAGVGDPLDVLVWLAGAVVLHDGLIAPLVLGCGLVVARGPARRVVRAALLVGGCLTVVALPVLLRPGTPANSSVLPLDYLVNWLVLLGITAGAAVAYAVVRRTGGPAPAMRRLRSIRWRGRDGVPPVRRHAPRESPPRRFLRGRRRP